MCIFCYWNRFYIEEMTAKKYCDGMLWNKLKFYLSIWHELIWWYCFHKGMSKSVLTARIYFNTNTSSFFQNIYNYMKQGHAGKKLTSSEQIEIQSVKKKQKKHGITVLLCWGVRMDWELEIFLKIFLYFRYLCENDRVWGHVYALSGKNAFKRFLQSIWFIQIKVKKSLFLN